MNFKRTMMAALMLVATFTTTLFAQNSIDYVPKDASMVVTFDFGNLNSKVPLAQFGKMNFYKMMMQQATMGMSNDQKDAMQSIMMNPEASGVDALAKHYLWMNLENDQPKGGMVMKIKDAAAFSNFVKGQAGDEADSFAKVQGFTIAAPSDEASMMWNDKFAFIMFDESASSSSYPMEELDEIMIEEMDEVVMEDVEVEPMPVPEPEIAIEEVIEEGLDLRNKPQMPSAPSYNPEMLKKAMAAKQEALVATVKGASKANSIASNAQFQKGALKKDDISIYMDYMALMKMSQENNPMLGMMGDMYEGTAMNMGLSFNAGSMDLSVGYLGNEKKDNPFGKALNGTFNPRLAKYMTKDNLGYLSLNFNLAEYLGGMMKVYEPMMGGADAMDAQIAQMLAPMGMNKEQAFNLLRGDIMFSVSGVNMQDVEVTTYEYDDDFNATPVTKMEKKPVPAMTLAMTFGNEDHLRSLIDMGVSMNAIQEDGKGYMMDIPSMGKGYIGIKKGVVVFTTDPALKKRKFKGYKGKDMASAQQLASMVSNSQKMKLYIPKIIEAAEEMGVPVSMAKMFGVDIDAFSDIDITAPKMNGASMESTFSINFKDQNENALKVIIGMIEAVAAMRGTNM